MNWFDKIKLYYEQELWDRKRVQVAMDKGIITKKEFEEIVDDKDN
jgi:hypothetical protein